MLCPSIHHVQWRDPCILQVEPGLHELELPTGRLSFKCAQLKRYLDAEVPVSIYLQFTRPCLLQAPHFMSQGLPCFREISKIPQRL